MSYLRQNSDNEQRKISDKEKKVTIQGISFFYEIKVTFVQRCQLFTIFYRTRSQDLNGCSGEGGS